MTVSAPLSSESSFALTRTRDLLTQGMAAGLHFGAQVYVAHRGQSLDLVLGERAPGLPMTADTLMIWLSSTKPVTAVAIAQLWERGRLALDDPIARHLPAFGVGGKEQVTIRHVLTHTGGFRLLNFGWPQAGWDEIIANICRGRLEPHWIPGQKAGYHVASSWFILGELVRRIDGRPLRDYVRAEIFLPLGLDDSWIGMPADRFRAYGDRIGWMYSTENQPALPRPWHRELHVVGCSPGGNGYGPIRDLGRFYECLLGHGERAGVRLLSPQTVEALTVPHRVGMFDHTFRQKLDWGLGFIINSQHYGAPFPPYGYGRHASRRTFGHSGFQSSTAFADPEQQLVVAMVVNGNPGEPQHTQRFRALAEAIYDDLGLARPLAEASQTRADELVEV